MARITCKTKKARNALIRRKIKEAAAALDKDKPRDAGIELHVAALSIRRNAEGIWTPKAIRDIGNDAFWVGSQLMKPSTMHWPKWKDRMAALVRNVDNEVKRTNARCK